jgi:hypothetical protein
MREKILDLLSGKMIDSVPVFSGLIHITAEGLKGEGLAFHEIHHDAQKMAKAAASTFKLTGIPSATLPLDLCAPAEMLGAELKFYAVSAGKKGGVFKYTGNWRIGELGAGDWETGDCVSGDRVSERGHRWRGRDFWNDSRTVYTVAVSLQSGKPVC